MKPTSIILALIPFTLALPKSSLYPNFKHTPCQALAFIADEFRFADADSNVSKVLESLANQTKWLRWSLHCDFSEENNLPDKQCDSQRLVEKELAEQIARVNPSMLVGDLLILGVLKKAYIMLAEMLGKGLDCSKDERFVRLCLYLYFCGLTSVLLIGNVVKWPWTSFWISNTDDGTKGLDLRKGGFG